MVDNTTPIVELIVVFLIGCLFTLLITGMFQAKTIQDKEELIKTINEARIKAENKQCCQVIQERYIDKQLDKSGLNFIYLEQPSIISCSDNYNYKGIASWEQ